MSERLNKPTVFLSHSKSDAALVERLYEDLRKCQIEPWLDTAEIRHGKPWLDAIFEDGIPTCDCIFVYLTEHSVTSAMVKKELDAAMLEQLRDKRVALLPYVSGESVRSRLRADIRALQVPVLNSGNYQELLPKVVAEIWRSFLERTVPAAVQSERLKRLESELEIERLRKASGDGIFTDSEQREFAYVLSQLDRYEAVEFRLDKKADGEEKTVRIFSFKVSVISILTQIADSRHYEYSAGSLITMLGDLFEPQIPEYDPEDKTLSLVVAKYPDLANELLMYGFVQRVHHDRPKTEPSILNMLAGPSHHFVYTDHLERFKYWLAFKDLLPEKLMWEIDHSKSENN